MALKHEGHEAIDSHDAYNRIKNRADDKARQMKTTQIRDHVQHPGKIAKKSDN